MTTDHIYIYMLNLPTSGGCWEEATRIPAASYKKFLKRGKNLIKITV